VLGGSATSANVSGSFAGRVRDVYPYRDITSGALPPGTPILIEPNGSEDVEITLTGVIGGFAVGAPIVGAVSGASAIVRSVNGSVLTVGDFVGHIFPGEVVNQAATAAFGIVSN